MTTIDQELENIPDFGENDGTQIDLVKIGEIAARAIYDSIQNASNGTERSKQQQDHFIGVSNLGHCRQYAKLLMTQTPFSDERDKTAAFFGTVAGDAIEQQLRKDHPDWLIQQKLVFPIPSGGEIPGTCDILIPFEAQDTENGIYQGVWDLKSKAELETIQKYGPSQQQIWQVHAYCRGGIDAGLFNSDEPILVGDVFFDRSGRDVIPYGVFYLYDPAVIESIDNWIGDVKYAVINGEDASRDMPREWCWSYCEYATVCRGSDTDVEGLITDPELLAAAEVMVEVAAEKKALKKREDSAKIALERMEAGGSTGTHNVRWTHVNPTFIEGYERAGYKKLSITPIKAPKAPKGKK